MIAARHIGTVTISLRFTLFLACSAMVYEGSNASAIADSVASLEGKPSPRNTTDGTAWSGGNAITRSQLCMVYDPIRDRFLVIGGFDNVLHNDIWAVSPSAPSTWTQILPSGAPPSPRSDASAIYDPLRDRVLLFGGWDGLNNLNDVWELTLSGTPTWSLVSTSGTPPIPRRAHCSIYDSLRDRLVIYGGFGNSNFQYDVWALPLSGARVWTQLVPLPGFVPQRDLSCAIFDPAGDRMIIFGGWANGYLNETWQFTFANGIYSWTQLSPTGPLPPPRRGHAAVFDPVRRRLVVFGGRSSGPHATLLELNDVWALSLSGQAAWTQLLPTGSALRPREGSSAAYDPVRDRMAIFGGSDGSGFFDDMAAVSLGSNSDWILLPQDGTSPVARKDHSAILDGPRDRMIVFGGSDGIADQSDLWSMPLSGPLTLSPLPTAGPKPGPRSGAAAIYDPVRERMVIFGGRGSTYLNDVWSLSLAGAPGWTPLATSGTAPSPRANTWFVYDSARDRMLILGGNSACCWFPDEVWALRLADGHWDQIPVVGSQSITAAPSAIYDPVRDRVVAFGGYRQPNYVNETWALNLTGVPAWAQLSTQGALPQPRGQSAAIYDPSRDRMVVFGGYPFGSEDLNDVWALSFGGTTAWSRLQPDVPLPTSRQNHSAIYDPIRDQLVTYGGFNYAKSSVLRDIWKLSFLGTPTAVLASVASVKAFTDRVEIAWEIRGGREARIYRRTSDNAWALLGSTFSDDSGRLEWIDRDVAPGNRYDYQLGVAGSDGEQFLAEVSVRTPGELQLALQRIHPNPTDRTIVDFVLPSASPATLELLDLSGRRIDAQAVGTLGLGQHRVELAPRAHLATGVYVVRLVQGATHRTVKVNIVR